MNKKSKKIYIVFVLFFLFSVSSIGCNPLTNFLFNPKDDDSVVVKDEEKPPPPLQTPLEEDSELKEEFLTITAVGDIMVHESQWLSQQTGESTYDFTNNFKFVKEIFKSSDLAIANLETTILKSQPIRTYPKFNSPPEILDALKDSGFSLISTANNHSMDTGMDGIFSTLDELNSREMDSFGTYKERNHPKFKMLEIKGIKLGLASFATGYFQSNGVRINKIDSKGMEKHINFMSLTSVKESFNLLKKEIQAMKDDGAEFIILYLHWGTEYQKTPDSYQRNLSQMLIDEGVDLILGSHPHMVQEMSYMDSTDGSREGLVCYSLGNFLSNQRNEILEMTGTEDGVISKITLEKEASGKVIIRDAKFIPTWIHRKELTPELFEYFILPLTTNTKQDSKQYNCDESELIESLHNTQNVMNDNKISMQDTKK